MSQWYAIRTATRRENATYDALTERKFTAFLPYATKWSQTRWTKEKIERPLYPGYMFVVCDPEDFAPILDIEGVHQFVRYVVGEVAVPMPIPLAAVLHIQIEERHGAYDTTRTYKPPYRPRKGDKVKVTSGPWQSFIGRVLNTPTKARALVMIEGPYGGGKTLDIAHLSAA